MNKSYSEKCTESYKKLVFFKTKRVGPTLVIVRKRDLLKNRGEFRLNQTISMLLSMN